MTIIAVANSKGGVGKSTTAVHLAAWLHKQGHTVIDLVVVAAKLLSVDETEASQGSSFGSTKHGFLALQTTSGLSCAQRTHIGI